MSQARRSRCTADVRLNPPNKKYGLVGIYMDYHNNSGNSAMVATVTDKLPAGT